MVVGLDLEHGREPVADVYRARILARPLQHPWPSRRQRLEMNARALVAAVLGPHRREDAELGQRWRARERFDNAFVLFGLQAVTFQDSGIRGRRHRETTPVAMDCTTDSKS